MIAEFQGLEVGILSGVMNRFVQAPASTARGWVTILTPLELYSVVRREGNVKGRAPDMRDRYASICAGLTLDCDECRAVLRSPRALQAVQHEVAPRVGPFTRRMIDDKVSQIRGRRNVRCVR